MSLRLNKTKFNWNGHSRLVTRDGVNLTYYKRKLNLELFDPMLDHYLNMKNLKHIHYRNIFIYVLKVCSQTLHVIYSNCVVRD